MQARLDVRDQVMERTYGRRELWASVLLLLLLSVLVRAIGLGRLPVTDELYTSLAAKGWLHYGEPRIGDGIYPRAQLYTLLLGGWFAVFGESIVSARLPSLVAGTLLVVAVFVWTRSVAGSLAAWIAGLFVALEPLSVQISQFARFYALHALIFWLAAIGVYSLVAGRLSPRGKLLVALGAGAGFLLAVHLQILDSDRNPGARALAAPGCGDPATARARPPAATNRVGVGRGANPDHRRGAVHVRRAAPATAALSHGAVVEPSAPQ